MLKKPEPIHILICGPRGAGKTTLIARIITETALPVCGYKTAVDSISADGIKTICMFPVNSGKKEGTVIGHSKNKVLDVNYDTFEDLGIRLVTERPDNAILIMDEIGYMETGSERFCREVIEAFDSNVYIIAAIKADDCGHEYLQMIKSHPSAAVFDLNESNRQHVYDAVKKIVNSWEKEAMEGAGK